MRALFYSKVGISLNTGVTLLTIKVEVSDDVFEDRSGIVKIVNEEKVVGITDLFIDVVWQ